MNSNICASEVPVKNVRSPPPGELDFPPKVLLWLTLSSSSERFAWVTSMSVWSSRDAYSEPRAIGGHLGVSAIAESSRRYGGVNEGCSVWGRSCDRGPGGEVQGCMCCCSRTACRRHSRTRRRCRALAILGAGKAERQGGFPIFPAE